MRMIYVDEELIRIEDGCGIRPLKKCPVQVYAKQHGIITTKNMPFPWKQTNIWIWTEADNKKFAVQIQNLCDSCYYGNAQKIKRSQEKTK